MTEYEKLNLKLQLFIASQLTILVTTLVTNLPEESKVQNAETMFSLTEQVDKLIKE